MILFETDKKPLTFLLAQIENYQLALPDFQRSFVWDPGATRELVVSILRSFPAGSLLLMQGGSEIFAPRAVEEAPPLKGPSAYLVLDGQQRLTSLYQAFTGRGSHRFFLNLQELIDGEDLDEAVEVYSAKAAAKWNDVNMQAQDLMLPLADISKFAPWRSKIQKAYFAAGEDVDKLEAQLIEIEQQVIKAYDLYQFPVTTLGATTPHEAVCTIFETLNRTGVKLSVFELITARAFANEVRLRDMWDQAQKDNPIIEEFAVEPYYVLQAIAVLVARSAKRAAVLNLKVEEILKHWDDAITGLAGSLRLLRDECGVLEPKWLPYTPMLVTMTAAWTAVASAKGPAIGARLEKLKRWFWCSVFMGTYDNSANSATERDVPELLDWFEDGEEPESVYSFSFDPARWREITGRQRAQYRATMALVMRKRPLDFHQGVAIDKALIEATGIDDHHVFPRAYLRKSKQGTEVDSVLNHTLIDRKTNIRISAKAPSAYLQEIQQELGEKLQTILSSHGLPSDPAGPLWSDDYDGFVAWREAHLGTELQAVTGLELANARPPRPAKTARFAASSGASTASGIPLRAIQLIEARATSDAVKELVTQVIQNFAALPDVTIRAGKSARTDDGLGRAIQLHRAGSPYGAFAFVYPRGSIILRLQGVDAKAFPRAIVRNVRERDRYKIKAPLVESDDFETARALTQLAYEAALD